MPLSTSQTAICNLCMPDASSAMIAAGQRFGRREREGRVDPRRGTCYSGGPGFRTPGIGGGPRGYHPTGGSASVLGVRLELRH
jgi:hypothetical protein